MTKHDKMYAEIEKHGGNLNEIFNTGIANSILCKKLLKSENKMHRLSLDYSNAKIESDKFEIEKDKILKSLDKILHYIEKKIPVFVNGDPRGYALKIDDKFITDNNITLYRDFGGYGIIAPDFSY